jgi:hypothetical protein
MNKTERLEEALHNIIRACETTIHRDPLTHAQIKDMAIKALPDGLPKGGTRKCPGCLCRPGTYCR